MSPKATCGLEKPIPSKRCARRMVLRWVSVARVRQPAPETVRHARLAHTAHVRSLGALPSTPWGGEHLQAATTVSAPRIHARLHRATLPETGGSSPPNRSDCPWHTARPFQVAIGPASGIISQNLTGYPPGGTMRASASAMFRACLATFALTIATGFPVQAQFENFTPVTDAMLENPDPADWLN